MKLDQTKINCSFPMSFRWVEPIIHACLVLGIAEILIVLTGTVWIWRALKSDCAQTPAEQTSMYVILGLIVLKWVGIGITAVIVLFSLKDLWPICCCRSRSHGQRPSLNDASALSRENATEWIMQHVTDPGECCFYLFKRCCVATKQIDYFNDVADLIHDMFVDDSFVPTDIAAALILLSAQSEIANEATFSEELNQNSELTSDENVSLLEDLMLYSSGSYGCAMYLLDSDNKCANIKSLCSQIACCSCCCCLPWSSVRTGREDFIEEDNCCGCNLATLQLRLPHIEEDDIVHVSFKNQFLETPFLVVADRKHKRIVISIRGTLSLADLMTDMVAKPVSLKVILQQQSQMIALSPEEEERLQQLPDDIEVHVGMAEAALYVFKQLREKHLLNKALLIAEGYSIVVTGHSLGAGTAVVLSFLLKLRHPDLQCYAFGPPGALLNQTAASISEEFTVSVIVGDDIVPRLSVSGYIRLRDRMRRALMKCQLPKHKILATGFCNCLSPDTWKERLLQDPSVMATQNQEDERQQQNYGGTSYSSDSNDIYGSTNWPLMLPPGRILHLIPNRSVDDDVYKIEVREAKEFKDMLVSPDMIMDHTPYAYQKAIKAIGTQRTRIVV